MTGQVVLPSADPVYGAIDCPDHPQCYQSFTLSVGAIQRLQQQGRSGSTGVLIATAVLTPDDRFAECGSTWDGKHKWMLYQERENRLRAITGATAVARFGTPTPGSCDRTTHPIAAFDFLCSSTIREAFKPAISYQSLPGTLANLDRQWRPHGAKLHVVDGG